VHISSGTKNQTEKHYLTYRTEEKDVETLLFASYFEGEGLCLLLQ